MKAGLLSLFMSVFLISPVFWGSSSFSFSQAGFGDPVVGSFLN